MIFVTVGTHEQPFDRLIRAVDEWAASSSEDVLIQTGVSSYEPVNCRWQHFFKQQEMYDFINQARIVITHGGPSCYFDVLKRGKIPIVVPRHHEFGEHVDDHQLEISREYKRINNSIILIEDIEQLSKSIDDYDSIITGLNNVYVSHTKEFCDEFIKIANSLFT